MREVAFSDIKTFALADRRANKAPLVETSVCGRSILILAGLGTGSDQKISAPREGHAGRRRDTRTPR